MISSPSEAMRSSVRLRDRLRRLCTVSGALATVFWLPAAFSQDNAVGLAESEQTAGGGAVVESVVEATETVYFRFADTAINAKASETLERIVARSQADDSLRVGIAAHTDNRGWSLGNLELSRQRARAVGRALIMQGLNVARITARAYGESMPLASNATAEGRRQNRRTEIVLLR